MRLVPSSRSEQAVRLGGLGPSLGAAASLVASGVALSLLIATLFGAPVWPGASDGDHGDALNLPAPPVSHVAVPEPVGGVDFAETRAVGPAAGARSARVHGRVGRLRAAARRAPRRQAGWHPLLRAPRRR